MLKRLFNLFVIAFLFLFLYSTRADILNFFNSLNINFQQNFENIKDISFFENLDQNTIFDNNFLIQNNETPGGLKVMNSVFPGNESTQLSIQGVIDFSNKERVANGLSPLEKNNKLNVSAKKKLDDMFSNQYFEHISPSGVGVSNLGDNAGYEYIIIGENLALGNFRDDEDLVRAWMESPGHRANILNKNYEEIGVAVGFGKYEDNYVWLAVQHFGLPKSSCPQINEQLKFDIESIQNRVDAMQKELYTMDKDIKLENTIEKIKEYNNLVNQYNRILSNLKENIEIYNLEVRAFNDCISSYK